MKKQFNYFVLFNNSFKLKKMLGKLVQRGVARNAIKMGKMVQPGQYVCFCGCAGGKVCNASIVGTQ